jgi:hypothetical protein
VSKKEIRRAARDAFPKARGASTARARGTRGTVNRRQQTAAGRPAPGRAVPRPPSIKRSLIFGAVAAVLYFVFIQWGLPRLFNVKSTGIYSNLLVSVLGLLLFAGVNYMSERFKYRRYIGKSKGPSK